MRDAVRSLVWCLCVATVAVAADVEITFVNNAVRTVPTVQVSAGRLLLPAENLSVPLEQVRDARIVSTNFSVEAATSLLERGDFAKLTSQLDAIFEETGDAELLPGGGIDQLLSIQATVSVLTGSFDEAKDSLDVLQRKNGMLSRQIPLMRIVIQIEQEQLDEASAAFASLTDADERSGALSEYIRGRLAAEDREYETALQHFSNVLVNHSGDSVWIPAAELAEGRVYKRTGYLEAAKNVADALSTAYPGAHWGRQAAELR